MPRLCLDVLEDRTTPALFTAQPPLDTGVNPLGFAVGDFNGDGRPDLVTSNVDENSVSVLLNGTPDGASPAFHGFAPFGAGNDPKSVAVADFNADGRPDLVVGNRSAGTVSVILNTTGIAAGRAAFAARQAFPAGGGPAAVVVGDFNADGRPDIAAANDATDTVSVLLNTTTAGAGISFAAAQTFAAGDGAAGIAAADFNADGRSDLVTADTGADTVSVLLNTTTAGAGTPTFATAKAFPAGDGPVAVAIGDFNGDGRPDVATANDAAGTVSVFLDATSAGAGVPSFVTALTLTAGTNPQSLAVGDFNGNGRPDVVVANRGGDTVGVLRNDTPDGSSGAVFTAEAPVAVAGGPLAVAVADLNADGRPDVAATTATPNRAVVLLNATSAYFGNPTPTIAAGGGTVGRTQVYNQTTGAFAEIGTGVPDILVAGPYGTVVGSYPDSGVWLSRASIRVFRQLSPVTARALAVDAWGNAYVSFPNGVYKYSLATGGFSQLATGSADMLAVDGNGNVTGSFGGSGVWQYRPGSGWVQINPAAAQALAVDPFGNVFVSFDTGTFRFNPVSGVFTLLGTGTASRLSVDASGNVVGVFPDAGVWYYRPTTGFQRINPAVAGAVGIDAYGNVYTSFFEAGTYRYTRATQTFAPLTGEYATRLAVW